MAKFKLNSTKLEAILKDYAEIREKTIPDVVMLNARLLCIELARRTQPFGEENNTGLERVDKDIGKVIKTQEKLNDMADRVVNKKLQDRLRKVIAAKNHDAIKAILAIVGFTQSWGGMSFVGSQSIADIHKSSRDKTTGRTRGKATQLFIAEESDLKTYTTEIQKRVGMSKAGWADCASQLKQVNKGSLLTGFPNWIKEAIKTGTGSVVDNTGNLTNPTVFLTNKIPWVDRICPESEQRAASAIVIDKMIKQMTAILKRETKI